jgi:hypothetical protein
VLGALVATEKLPKRHSEDSTMKLLQGDSSWTQETSERTKDQKRNFDAKVRVCVCPVQTLIGRVMEVRARERKAQTRVLGVQVEG